MLNYDEERNKRLVEAFDVIFKLMMVENASSYDVKLIKDGLTVKMTCSVTNMNELNLSKYIN